MKTKVDDGLIQKIAVVLGFIFGLIVSLVVVNEANKNELVEINSDDNNE